MNPISHALSKIPFRRGILLNFCVNIPFRRGIKFDSPIITHTHHSHTHTLIIPTPRPQPTATKYLHSWKKRSLTPRSLTPQFVTRKLLEGLEHNVAGASVLAKQNDVFLRVIDVGLAAAPGGDPCADSLESFGNGGVVEASKHEINGGTKSFVNCPAMTHEELDRCMLAGRQDVGRIVDEMKARPSTVLIFGEIGIGKISNR